MTDKKPLVALLTNNDDDVYCFRKELIDGILNSGYSLLISCPYGEKFELMTDYEYIYDDLNIDRRGTNIFADLKLLIHYIKLLKKYRPDIVLTYTAKPGVYGSIAARMLKIPYINNVTGFGSVLSKGGFMKKFIMNMFKFAYKKSNCIMFQNSTNMKLAEEVGIVGQERVLIPGSGVALDRYPIQPYPNGGNGIDGETVRFNYFGRVMKDKGIDNYLECAKRIKSKYPNTEFNICGFIEPSESHYKEILDKLQKDNIVLYHGSQKDVKPFITRAHAIIHPSTYGEGMSNVLLENASSARPAFTTDNPGCKETVQNGVTGYVYRGGNVDELVDIVEKFLAMPNDERQKMGLAGREYVEQNFSRDIVVSTYLDKMALIIKSAE